MSNGQEGDTTTSAGNEPPQVPAEERPERFIEGEGNEADVRTESGDSDESGESGVPNIEEA